jgi:hypothetical protein
MLTWGQTVSVKQVILESQDFPPLSPDGEYLLRYRVVSEDKNRTSHWSPVYKIDVARFIEPVSGDIRALEDSLGVSVIWGKSELQQKYDIFVSFGVYNLGTSIVSWSDYSYLGSSNTETYSFLRQEIHTDIRVKVQLAGIEKTVSPTLNICTLEKSLR